MVASLFVGSPTYFVGGVMKNVGDPRFMIGVNFSVWRECRNMKILTKISFNNPILVLGSP